jgi:hypothetical protein
MRRSIAVTESYRSIEASANRQPARPSARLSLTDKWHTICCPSNTDEHEIHSSCSHNAGITEGRDMAANPYAQGWREWDERYADLVIGKPNWQIASACFLLISVLAVGIVWLA